MKLSRTDFCPLVKEPCRQLGCNWFIQLRGRDPQSGEEIDDYRCTMAFLPLLLIENSAQTRQAGAAIESFRNEVVRSQRDATLGIAQTHSVPEPKLIEAAE